jgi:hypothetical protein
MTLRVLPGRGVAIRGAISDRAALEAAEAPGKLLPLPYVSQKPYTNLCWAACVEMVLRRYGDNTHPMCKMCSMVAHQDCCNAWNSGVCDRGHWPADIYAAYEFSCSPLNTPVTPQAIAQEIDAGKPVEVFYQWSAGGFHTALVYGYYADGRFALADPLFGTTPAAYDAILHAYGRGGWIVTYYNLAPPPHAKTHILSDGVPTTRRCAIE